MKTIWKASRNKTTRMLQKTKHVWYASYGSNLLESRFLCYILGGLPEGAQKTNPGCTDKTLPLDSKVITINIELYFAKRAKRWDAGGVGFKDPELLNLKDVIFEI